MSAITDSLAADIINHFFRNSSVSSPATVYMALFTAAPAADGTGGTEVSGGSYARQAIAFGAPSGDATDNTGTITFPTASANWGSIIGVGLSFVSSAGTQKIYAALSATQVINSGGTFSIATGNGDLSFP
jgi:hypothetical protein